MQLTTKNLGKHLCQAAGRDAGAGAGHPPHHPERLGRQRVRRRPAAGGKGEDHGRQVGRPAEPETHRARFGDGPQGGRVARDLAPPDLRDRQIGRQHQPDPVAGQGRFRDLRLRGDLRHGHAQAAPERDPAGGKAAAGAGDPRLAHACRQGVKRRQALPGPVPGPRLCARRQDPEPGPGGRRASGHDRGPGGGDEPQPDETAGVQLQLQQGRGFRSDHPGRADPAGLAGRRQFTRRTRGLGCGEIRDAARLACSWHLR